MIVLLIYFGAIPIAAFLINYLDQNGEVKWEPDDVGMMSIMWPVIAFLGLIFLVLNGVGKIGRSAK